MSASTTVVQNAAPEPRAGGMAMRRPRILQLISSFEVGGTEMQLIELLKRVDRDRYSIRVAAIHCRGPLLAQATRLAGVIPSFPLRRFYDFNAVAQVAKLRSFLIRHGIDVLHAHDFYSGLLGSVAARTAGIRVVASQRHLKLSDRRVHDWGTRLIRLLSDTIIVNSEAVRERVLRSGTVSPRKVVLIPNGLRSARSNNGRQPDARRARLCSEVGIQGPVKLIATVARLEALKGHRFLLEAAAALSGSYPSLHYCIIGDGSLRGSLSLRAARLGLSERVHFLGERHDVLDLLPAFDLTVLPSLHEGFPNAVMESMAAGVPVVATSAGGTAELIRDGVTGYLIAPADSEALARRIAFAFDNPELTAAIAKRGRDFVCSRFDADRMAAAVQETYERLTAMPKQE